MGSERNATIAVTATLLLAGSLAWWFELRPPLTVDPSPLAEIPLDMGAWRSREIPLEETVESMLQADYNLQRVHVHPLGAVVWSYVGYYGTDRGGRPEHTPRTCYRAHGWEIVSQRTVTIDAKRGLRANEYIVEREGERRLVHFWFRTYRKTGILTALGLNLDHLVGRLQGGRADGALVRLSTPLDPGDEILARGRLLALATEVEARLAEHWPTETPKT